VSDYCNEVPTVDPGVGTFSTKRSSWSVTIISSRLRTVTSPAPGRAILETRARLRRNAAPPCAPVRRAATLPSIGPVRSLFFWPSPCANGLAGGLATARMLIGRVRRYGACSPRRPRFNLQSPCQCYCPRVTTDWPESPGVLHHLRRRRGHRACPWPCGRVALSAARFPRAAALSCSRRTRPPPPPALPHAVKGFPCPSALGRLCLRRSFYHSVCTHTGGKRGSPRLDRLAGYRVRPAAERLVPCGATCGDTA